MSANAWRTISLETQPPQLVSALAAWQGHNGLMRRIMEALSDPAVRKMHKAAIRILDAMDATFLPKGTTLFHATSLDDFVPDPSRPLATMATREAAEAYGKRRFAQYKVHTLFVDSDRVCGLAVGSDPAYENEKEVLVAPGFDFQSTPDGVWLLSDDHA